MNTLRDYVEWKLTHSDKTAVSEGYPLILENCKKNKKMKDLKVYGNSAQDGTPTPESPVEVQSVGVKTRNLYSAENISIKSSWNVNKATCSVTDRSITAYTNAENDSGFILFTVCNAKDYAGKTLYMSYIRKTDVTYVRYTGVVVYDGGTAVGYSDKNDGVDMGLSCYNYITIPEDVTDTAEICLRLYCKNFKKDDVVQIDDIMISESAGPLSYEPYGKYKVPIVQKGGNLYDVKTYPMTKGCYVNGQSTVGEIVEGWAKYAATLDYIPCAELRQKTITINHTGGNTPGVCFYDDELSFISGVPNRNGTSITTTVPNNASYYRFSILAEYIDEATVYVEQSIHNVFLDEPLRKIGDYADYIDFKNQRVVRNTGSTIFNGTENWTYEKLSYGNNFYVKIPDAVPDPYTQAMCNMGSWVSWTISSPYNIRISQAGNFNFRYEDYDNLTDFKNKLSEMHLNNQPLNVTYALKTEAFEDISYQLPKPITKTTIFTVDSTVEPSNMYGKYIK